MEASEGCTDFHQAMGAAFMAAAGGTAMAAAGDMTTATAVGAGVGAVWVSVSLMRPIMGITAHIIHTILTTRITNTHILTLIIQATATAIHRIEIENCGAGKLALFGPG